MTQVKNSLTQQSQKPKFSVLLQQDAIKNLINNTLNDPKKSTRFIASISSAVAVNPALQECDGGTIISGALLGESLNLSPSPVLGHYYLVPFNDNKLNRKVAVWQIGYRGMIQLAIRSGQYKKINVIAIKEGELVSYDPLEEELKVNIMDDELKRESAKTIGYYAMFELITGFKKTMYWSKEKMESHAMRYSQGYQAKKGYTFWEKDFDGMAFKTMLRQLISKWGVMSIELQNAYESDNAAIKEDGTKTYVDNDITAEFEQIDVTPTETKVEKTLV